MNQVTDIISFIKNFIQTNSTQPELAIDEHTNFVEAQLLDSFGILSLIMALETNYQVKFAPEELAEQQLRIIKNLAQSVAEKANK